MSIEVRPLDAWDDAEFAAAHAVLVEADRYQRPSAVPEGQDVVRAGLVRPSSSILMQAWLARLDGAPAGVLLVAWPLVDDVQACWPVLAVAPAVRRRGVGSALYATLTRAMRMAGRRIVQVEIPHPADAEAWPGVAFAQRRGFQLALREVRSILHLPVPEARLDGRPGDGYTLRTWRDDCPDDLVEGYCRMRELFETHAPTGDLVISEQHWDEARVREQTARRRAQGISSWTTVALAPDGTTVGFTELVVVVCEADASQHQTLVLPEHRGHRLGAAMKAANLRRMAADLPGVQRVHTTVEPANSMMNAVNEALGFVPAEVVDEWQLELTDQDS